MIAIVIVFMFAAAVTMTSADQEPTAPHPEPALIVIEKIVVIECVPLRRGERLERDLTVPFEKRHYLNPTGDPCRKETVTTTKSIEPSEPLEPDILKDKEWL
ncbi:MAG: hypothetical protein JMN27_17550 [gamma proteobacterium endosymbiont of Lamellibrachia anaximandri]|nr:hypothetical protein [gamma proteobacterium endosymbiont of Lamellibrachia anaximandri]MBL3535613.1 hypothetical protein [gamma proteobacterium endosymbiont of Lamellibrachia anaximandri]